MTVSESLQKLIDEIPQYAIQIGVFSNKTNRKSSKKQSVSVGITNAELMFIHENGSPLRHIPARPVLHLTVEYGNSILSSVMTKALDAYFKSGETGYETELKKMCIKMENFARQLIYSNDGRLAPNAPSTIAKKGDNHPLFDTGQLTRSITCKLVKL